MFAEKTSSRSGPTSGALHIPGASPASPVVQRKMTVGATDDPMEREADHMADHVMRMPDTVMHTPDAAAHPSAPGFVQRKCRECEKEEKLHRKEANASANADHTSEGSRAGGADHTAGDTVSTGAAQSILSSAGKGSSLDDRTQSFMSSRFGADFGQVKIHADGQAAQLSRDLNAKAFTVGRDIYFNSGQYQPGSSEGRRLLAHELTHTLQQGGGSPDTVSRAPAHPPTGATTSPPTPGTAIDAARERLLDSLHRNDSMGFLARLKALTLAESNGLQHDQVFWKEVKSVFSGASLWAIFTILFFRGDKSLAQRKLSLALSDRNITDAMDAVAIITAEEFVVEKDYWDMLEEVIFSVFAGNPLLNQLFRLIIIRDNAHVNARNLKFSSKEVHFEKNASTGAYQLSYYPGNPSLTIYTTQTEIRVLVRIRFVDGLNPSQPYNFSRPEDAGLPEKWKSAIEQIWNNKFELSNASSRLRFTVVPIFVYENATADKTVRILTSRTQTCPNETTPGRADENCWFADPHTDTRVIAHEFGHLLGANDEYNLPGSVAEIPAAMQAKFTPAELALTTMQGIGGTALPATPLGHSIDGLMGHHYNSTEVKERHIRLLVQALNASLPADGQPYTAKKL